MGSNTNPASRFSDEGPATFEQVLEIPAVWSAAVAIEDVREYVKGQSWDDRTWRIMGWTFATMDGETLIAALRNMPEGGAVETLKGFDDFVDRAAAEADVFGSIRARLLVASAHLCGESVT